MKSVQYIPLKYQNILIKCVEGIHDKELQQKVYRNIGNFKERSEEYEKLAKGGKLYLIDSNLKDGFTYEQMKFLYSKLRDSPHARTYYDFILGLSVECPYCYEQRSASLDHYLPKFHYSMFSVDPMNLVPSCTDCNSNKSENKQTLGNETFHPYFDDVGNERWLFTSVRDGEKVAFNYSVRPTSDLSEYQFNKIAHHFETLKLAELYNILASGELHSQIFHLRKVHKNGGSDGKEELKKALDDIYQTNYAINRNSWKTAMYEALKEDDWFCTIGINNFEYVDHKSDLNLAKEEELPIPK